MNIVTDSSVSGLFIFCAGIILGSFGNVLIYRIPHSSSILGRSRCPHCKTLIKAYDLIPLLSFLLLQGKCRTCGKRISSQYPLVELSSGVLFVLAWAVGTPLPLLFLLFFALWLLLLIGVIDFQTQMIPDILSVVLLVIGAWISFSQGILEWQAPLIAFAFFAVQWVISRGRWVGSGDLLLALAIGSLLGTWEYVVAWIFLAYILGGIAAAFILLTKKNTFGGRLAFAPFLALSAGIVLLFGDQLVLFGFA